MGVSPDEQLAAAEGSLPPSRQDGPIPTNDSHLMLIQQLAGIGSLTAGAAQEMSYPISIITATCANLIDELKSDALGADDLTQALRSIEQNALRCGRIVEALRHYADAGEAHSDSLAVAITSPEAILEDTLLMVERQFHQGGRVAVLAEFPKNPVTIVCEHHAITQVLVNLLLNARNAMQPRGGTVRVRFWVPDLAREPHLTARVQSTPGPLADLIAFSVTDSGAGIPPSIKEHLFDPLLTTKPQGLGLGLSVAHDIVTRHGGMIWGENNPQGGATFTVVLPRKP